MPSPPRQLYDCTSYIMPCQSWKWLDSRRLTNICERWSKDHTDALQYALFNGDGFESWENVWGTWNGYALLPLLASAPFVLLPEKKTRTNTSPTHPLLVESLLVLLSILSFYPSVLLSFCPVSSCPVGNQDYTAGWRADSSCWCFASVSWRSRLLTIARLGPAFQQRSE